MQADLFEQAPVCEASAACAQLVLAHTREPGPMGACAWAWTLFGAPLPRGLATQGAGGSLVSQPGQPGLWALEHALLSLQAALPVQLTLDCTYVQSGIELGPVRRRTKFKDASGQWVPNACTWQRVLDLLELTDVRGVTVRALSANPAGVQAGLRRLFEDGHRIALLNDTALF